MNVILWLLFSLGFGEVSVAHPAPSCRGTVLEIDGEDVCVERSMALANRHSCAIRDGGRLYCWGDLAQVGGGVEAGDGEFRPQEVPGLEGVVEVVGSPQPSENAYPSPSLPGSTCARLSSGEVWCWRRRSSDRPEEPAATEAVGVAMSLHEVCVATAEGRVLCHQHARRSGQPVAGELRGPEEVDGISEVVDVVGGWAHFRALHEDQRVSCWGDNQAGAVSGERGRNVEPRLVEGLTEVVQVTAGYEHSCALRRDGTVWCWGRNQQRQTGADRAVTNAWEPVQVEVEGVVQVDAGTESTCAVDLDETVWCWGRGRAQPLPVEGFAGSAVAVEVGRYTVCVREDEARIYCQAFGRRDPEGRQGYRLKEPLPRVVEGLPEVEELVLGAEVSCARDRQERWWCWGDGVASPQRVDELPEGLDVSSRIGCEVRSDGAVLCRGGNVRTRRYHQARPFHTDARGMLGIGEVHGFRADEPVRVVDIDDAEEVAVGTYHGCVRREPGDVWCWGENRFGQLGDGSFEVMSRPVVARGVQDAVAIAAGGEHTCALVEGGRVWCWGWSREGQTGQGRSRHDFAAVEWEESPPAPGPAKRSPPSIEVNPRRISARQGRTCAVVSDRLWCWGEGVGEPVEIDLGGSVDEVAVGEDHQCARRGGDVWCWGGNRFGQVGDGTEEDAQAPVRVPLESPARQIVAGDFHSCAVLIDGRAVCWGLNTEGQLGDGSFLSRSRPSPVVGVEGLEVLILRGSQAMGRLDDGRVVLWGDGLWTEMELRERGERGLKPRAIEVSRFPDARDFAFTDPGICVVSVLGIFSCGGSRRVDQRPDLEGSVEIHSGDSHRCVRTDDGEVRCWGENLRGQLGVGDRDDRAAPTIVDGLTAVVEVATGDEHVCALLASGEVFCWGRNHRGQVGDGTTEDRLVPVRVPMEAMF